MTCKNCDGSGRCSVQAGPLGLEKEVPCTPCAPRKPKAFPCPRCEGEGTYYAQGKWYNGLRCIECDGTGDAGCDWCSRLPAYEITGGSEVICVDCLSEYCDSYKSCDADRALLDALLT